MVLPDPSKAEGTDEERLNVFRRVRDDIEGRTRRELIGPAAGEEDGG